MEEEEVADRLREANSAAAEEDGSLIIYTSGTTGRPKGEKPEFCTVLSLCKAPHKEAVPLLQPYYLE